jgi:hypothetical protein
MKSSNEDLELVRLYLDSQATAEEVNLLEQKMRKDHQLRKDFLSYARVDAALPYASNIPEKQTGKTFRFPSWSIWSSVAAIIVFLFALDFKSATPALPESSKQAIAYFEKLENCRWMNRHETVDQGSSLFVSDRIELSSGKANVLFSNGAIISLEGPSIVEISSVNSVFLSLGRAQVVAETLESHGFSITTPSSTFVDLGTSFTATVAPDGLSHLNVTQGKVNLIIEEDHVRHLIEAGEAIFVEPGKHKVLTKIESGNESKDFIFPSIPPPSQDDYADASHGIAKVLVPKGSLRKLPGWEVNPMSLLDGKGQTVPDSPKESVFLEKKGGTFGNLLIDLGKDIAIDRVNSYSWHQHQKVKKHKNRAKQVFTLYGLQDQEVPDLNLPLIESGWKRIARVNSDRFFDVREDIDRPAQQACSIFASKGKIGDFRYLLVEVHGPTFFGEIDIFGNPVKP